MHKSESDTEDYISFHSMSTSIYEYNTDNIQSSIPTDDIYMTDTDYLFKDDLEDEDDLENQLVIFSLLINT